MYDVVRVVHPLPGKAVQFRRAIISHGGLKNIAQFIQVLSSDDTSGGMRGCVASTTG